MKYNIYSNGDLLTDYPICDKVLSNIKKTSTIKKVDPYTRKETIIPYSRCRVVKCIDL